MMKRWLLIMYPYLICIVVGTAILVGAYSTDGLTANLLLSMSAAFFVIPCLFVLYESVKKASERHLNRELYEYAKMQIDSEVLSIASQLIKSMYSYEETGMNEKRVQSFLEKELEDIKKTLAENEYIGFQVLKDWSNSIRNTKRILENPFIIQKLENEQAINVVKILRGLTNLEVIHKQMPGLYEIGDKKVQGYKVQGGTEINPRNVEYPDRYLLLQYLEGDKYLVKDFGDFPLYQVSNLLNICKIKKEYIDVYAEIVTFLMQAIEGWLACTNYEMIIDPSQFKGALSTNNRNNKRSE